MPIAPLFSPRRARLIRLSVAAALVSVLGLTGVSNQAMAVDFDTSAHQTHQDWQTLIATLGDESHVRAVQRTSYSDAMLSVNATPGHCRTPWIEVRSDLGQRQAVSEVVNRVPIDLLVDEQRAQTGTAVLSTQRGDDGLYVRVNGIDMDLLASRLATGEQLHLRLRMTPDTSDYWFMSFSLNGAFTAWQRMQTLCRAS